MKQSKLEINAVHGGKRKTNFEINRAEDRMDMEVAQKEAFGDSMSEKELKTMNYEYYKNAMDLVKAKGKETEAITEFSKELKKKIAKKISIEERQIKIINAVGTPLDKYHGVSAWVEIAEQSIVGGKVIITLDIFADEENRREKADVIFQKPECGFSPKVDDEEYNETLSSVAENIINKFKIKTNQLREPRAQTEELRNNAKKIVATKPTFEEKKTKEGKPFRVRRHK